MFILWYILFILLTILLLPVLKNNKKKKEKYTGSITVKSLELGGGSITNADAITFAEDLIISSSKDIILQSNASTNLITSNYTLYITDLGINNGTDQFNVDTAYNSFITYFGGGDLNISSDSIQKNYEKTFSIITNHNILAREVDVYSDERIKNNITDIDTKNALDIIRKIQPKRYTYKDILNKGDKPVWGFIAQQVKSLIENSTNIVTEFIPDIYELAQVLDYNIIKLDINTIINFEINEKIRLVKNDGKYLDTKITCVLDNYTFTIEENINQEQIFVYGREVHDLNTLNKDCIFTIATSALKEVDKELQNEKI